MANTEVPAASIGLDAGQPAASAALLPPPTSQSSVDDAVSQLPAPPKPSQLKRGFGAGIGSVESGAGGLVRMFGDTVGDLFPGAPGTAAGMISKAGEAIAGAGREREEANPSPVSSIHDLNAGNFGDFVAYTVGASIPQFAEMAAGAVLGKRIAGGSEVGALAGGAAAGGLATAGDIYNEATNANLPDPTSRAALGGLAAGALNAVPVGKALSLSGILKDSPVLSRLFGEATGNSFGSKMENIAKEAVTTGAIVGGVGAATSEVQRAALDKPLTGAEAGDEAAMAALQGALVGAPLGAGSAALGHLGRVREIAPPDLEARATADTLPPPPTVPPTAAKPATVEIEAPTPLPKIDPNAPVPDLPSIGIPTEINRQFTGIRPAPTPELNPTEIRPLPDITNGKPLPDAASVQPESASALPKINRQGEIGFPQLTEPAGLPDLPPGTRAPQPAVMGMTLDEIARGMVEPHRMRTILGGFEPPAIPLDSVERASASATEAMHKGIVDFLNVKQYEKGGKYATGQKRVESVNRQEHTGGEVGGKTAGPSSSDSLEHGPQGGSADSFSPGMGSWEKQTLVEVARLRERNGFTLSDEESTALRRADLPADVPTLGQQEFPGMVTDKNTFIRQTVRDHILEQGKGLPEATLERVTKAADKVITDAAGKPEMLSQEALGAAIGEAIRRSKIPGVDKETFASTLGDALDNMPRTYYSKAATHALTPDGKVALTHWGNVPGGVTDPNKMGTGVAGRDQRVKEFGLSYTSAVIRGTEYREGAVQARQEHVIKLDPSKIYNAIEWRTDPMYKAALEEIKDRYGLDQTAALARYQQRIINAGYEAALWANGQVRIYTPQAAEKVKPLSEVLKTAKNIGMWHELAGGSTTDLNTGRDLSGTQGFSVSTYKGREVKVEGYPTDEQIREYMQQHHDALSIPGNVLGTWFNPDDGHTYLDVASVVPTIEDAQRLARLNDQLAVFDLSTMTTIPTEIQTINQAENYRRSGEVNYDSVIGRKGEEVTQYLDKILGAPQNLEVKLVPSIRDSKGEMVAGVTRIGKIKDVIGLAYNGEDMMSTAAHEGYHYLEQRALSAADRAVVNQAMQPGRPAFVQVMAKLRAYDALHGTEIAKEAAAVPAEARAYGFQMWRNGGLKAETALVRAWQKIKDVIDKVTNFVQGNGFQSYQDVFNAIERGEYARMDRKGIRTNSSIHDEWYGDVEHDVLPGAESTFKRIGAGPAQKTNGPSSAAKGRPWWVKTPADVARMRGIVRSLALDGDAVGARDWHERSGSAVISFVNGDLKAATTLAKLISNFSPRTPVGLDLLKAVRAMAQYRAGVTVDPGAPKQHIEGAIKIMRDGTDVTGIKRGNFFNNLMQRIDPDNYGIAKQGATIDMWMAHAFGFAHNTEGAVSKSEYNYANAEIQRLANELGWRVDETQAAVWVAIKARANYVRGQMEKFATANGYYDFKLTKSQAAGTADLLGNVTSTKRVIKPEKQRDYVMNWMNMAMQAQPPIEEFHKANYSYAEAIKDLNEGKLDLRLEGEAAKQAAEDYDLGFVGDDITPEPENLTLFSKAALVDGLQRARNGQDEPSQIRRALANHIDRAEIPEELMEKAFGIARTQGTAVTSKIREFYEKNLATGMFLSRRSEGYKNVFNALTYYSQRVSRLIFNSVERDLSTWLHAPLADERAVSAVLLERTINRWGNNAPELSNKLSALTPEQRGMYEQARKMMNSRLVEEFRADQASYQRVFGLKPAIVEQMIKDYSGMGKYDENLMKERYGEDGASYMEWYTHRESQVQNLIEQGYFPERRYGDHAVHVYLPTDDGKKITMVFELHEGKAAALQRQADLAKAVAAFPELRTEYAYKFKADYNGSMSYQQFLDTARRQGVQLTQAEKERIAKALLSADSTKNNRIFKREDIPGMSQQGLRILAEFGVGTSKKIAYSELGHTVEDALKGNAVDVQFDEAGRPTVTSDGTKNVWDQDGELAGYYHDLASKTASFVTNPPEGNAIARGLRATASFQFLGGSIAAAVVNLSALPMNTVPYLTQHTTYTDAMAKTFSALKTAGLSRSTLADVPKLLDPNTKLPGIDEVPGLRKAITKAAQDGTVIDTEIFQIMGLTRGQQYSLSRPLQAALNKWMAPFLLGEQINRIAGFIAGYRVGLGKGMAGDALYAFAKQTVDMTHGRFDEANKPGISRSALGSVLYTFKAWSLFSMELLGHLAAENKKAAAFMLLSLSAMSGIEGLPFAQDAENIIDTIAQRVFGSDFNSNRALRNVLKDMSESVAGADLSQVFMHGAVNNITGMSFASRVGLGHLIPGSRLGAADADFKQQLLEIAGPAGGVVPNALSGLDMANRGQWEAASQKLLPLAAANAQKAYLQWQRGYAADSGGRKLIDTSGPWELAQAFGFSSEAMNQAYELDRMDKQSEAYYQQVKKDFEGDIRKAAALGKMDEVSDAINAVAAWNERHPNMPIALDVRTLQQQIAEAGLPLNQRTFMGLPKLLRANSTFAIGLGQEGQ